MILTAPCTRPSTFSSAVRITAFTLAHSITLAGASLGYFSLPQKPVEAVIALTLIVLLFVVLGSGLWIGLSLLAVAVFAMEFLTTRPAGDSMALTVWGSTSSWTLTALPLFIWMGEILFRTRLSNDMFRGLSPWVQALPGRLLHTNVIGCAIFAAVSGSSAATCATIGKMTLPELKRRGYPDDIAIGSLAGAGTLGLLIPPSIIMIVYGVTADVSIAQLFIAGVLPGVMLAALFSGYLMVWGWMNPTRVPPPDVWMVYRDLSAEQPSYGAKSSRGSGQIDTVVLGADPRWQALVHYFDTNCDGLVDLIGYDARGEGRPERYSPSPAEQRRTARRPRGRRRCAWYRALV